MYPIHTILHPTDFTPAANFAFQMACTLAKDHNARLILLHVVPDQYLTNQDMPGLSLPSPAAAQEPREKHLPWPQPTDPNLRVEHRVAENDNAPSEILRIAEEVHCDLIVMGTQGRTGLSRWLAGSVAEEVLRKAPCPVLAVKAPPFTPVSHARPGEVVDVRPLGAELPSTKTKALVKTKEVEVIRMVVPAGKEIPTHQAKGEMVVQCLEGRIEFTALGTTQSLGAGQLCYLPKHEAHSVKGLEDASLLVTILLPK